jgi:single-stranded-DNA-specific exonuclease
MVYPLFLKDLEKNKEKIITLNKPMHIVAHHDSDGLSSAALMVYILKKLKKEYYITIVPYLDLRRIKELKKKKGEMFCFLDIGSSHTKEIKQILTKKDILIIDHHEITKDSSKKNIVNPMLRGAKSKEYSGAAVTYLFLKKIDNDIEKYSYLPIVGAVGDCQ